MNHKLDVYGFEVFWARFHFLTNQHKVNKTACKTMWDSYNCKGKKRAIIDSVDKGIKITALEYLRTKLNKPYETKER